MGIKRTYWALHASACAIALAATSAHAQAAAGNAAPSTSSQATPDTSTAPEIVVTGYRASLEKAQTLKRRAPQVIEAITPEDIGKFTDNSIADELQRVPGLQIQRNDTGRIGDRLSIRGLGPAFVVTTIDGRTPASNGDSGQFNLRSFDLDQLPTEILNGATIYKTPSAELIESGIAGEVDFTTLKPLDYKSKFGNPIFGSISAKTDNQSQVSRWGRGVSGVVGGKFFNDTLGFDVVFDYSKDYGRTDQISNTLQYDPVHIADANGHVTTQNVLLPTSLTSERILDGQNRRSVGGDVQWRPTDRFELNFDYTYNRYDRPRTDAATSINFLGAGGGILAGTFGPGGLTIVNGAAKNINFSDFAPSASKPGTASEVYLSNASSDNVYDNFSTGQIGGVNAKWHSDRFKIAADYSISRLHSSQNNSGVSIANVYLPSLSGISYDAGKSGPATVTLGGNNILSPSLFSPTAENIRIFQNKTHQNAFKLDTSYELSDTITLKAGGRYTSQDVDIRAANAAMNLTAAQSAELQPLLFPGGTITNLPGTAFGLNTIANVSARNAINSTGFLPDFTLDQAPFNTPFFDAPSSTPFIFIPGNWYAVQEKTLAFYGQADGHGTLFGMPFEGNLGVRAVQTKDDSQAFSVVSIVNPQTLQPISNSSPIPQSANNSYWRFLPSWNFTLHPRDNINLRLGVAETMTRPEFDQISPINTISVPDPSNPLTNPTIHGFGSANNPNLKPEMSWNFDTTLEYYTHSDGAFVVSLFYKKVRDFIFYNTVFGVTLPDHGSQLFDLTSVENVSKGKAYGAEIGFNQPLTFLPSPWNGFGIQANYTYVNTSLDTQLNGQTATFPGASKHNINGTIYYQKGPFEIRAAYVWRSNYLNMLANGLGTNALPVYTAASGTLDGSVGYKFGRGWGLTITGTNLFATGRRDYVFSPSTFTAYYSRSRTVSFALRKSF